MSCLKVLFIFECFFYFFVVKLNETPLHFACKFGAYEVARILMSYEICSKRPLNKKGERPEDVICGKIANHAKELYDSIRSLFDGKSLI